MSFLDNLENALKSLETREESSEQQKRDREVRDAERAQELAAAPYADQLRTSSFTTALLERAVQLGHAQRTKVHMAWIGSTLRLDAKERRLELRPEATGITAVFLQSQQEMQTRTIDLEGDPGQLAEEWLVRKPEAPSPEG